MAARSDFELFQSFLRRWVNLEVKEYFGKFNVSEQLEASRPESVIRALCLHEDRDPISLTILRLWLWGRISPTPVVVDDLIYGIPLSHFQSRVEFAPQLFLFFRQTLRDQYRDRDKKDKSIVRMELSLRLPESFNIRQQAEYNMDLRLLSEAINRTFRKATYQKGINKFTYYQPSKGYRLSLNMDSEQEAKRLIEDVLTIQGHRPDWNLLDRHSANRYKQDGTLKDNPIKQVLGKPRKSPISRKKGEIELYYAEFKVHGANDLCLIKRRSSRKKALALFD